MSEPAISLKPSRPNTTKFPNQRQSNRSKPNEIEGWSLHAEPVTLAGSQICWEGAAEHRSLALGLLLGCFILNDVPMLHKDAVFKA